MSLPELATLPGQLAVVPSVLGGVNTLLLVLPQIAVALVLALKVLRQPSAWKAAVHGTWETLRHRPLHALTRCAVAVVVTLGVLWCVLPTSGGHGAAAGTDVTGEWPGFHGGMARAGAAPPDAPVPAEEPRVRWQFREPLLLERMPFVSSPAVAGSLVVVGSDNQFLYGLDAQDGRVHWRFAARHPVFSSPAIADGRVYVGEGLHYTQDARVYCLDLHTGRLIWSFQTRSHTESSPTVVGGRVYIGAGDDGVYCLDAQTGRRLWRFAEGHVDSGVLVVGDRVYFGSGYVEDALFCVAADDGRLLWKRSTPAPVWGAPSSAAGRVYIGIGTGNFEASDPAPRGEVWCLEAATGDIVWQFKDVADGVLSAVALAGGRAVFGARSGVCHALDAATGEALWSYETGGAILATPAVTTTHVIVGSDDGILRCLDLVDGRRLWSHDTSDDVANLMQPTGRILGSPAITGHGILFGTSSGSFYCLDGGGAEAPVAATSAWRSPLLRATDRLLSGSLGWWTDRTGSMGLALIVTAVLLRVLLLPLDWVLARQSAIVRGLKPQLDRMRREFTDWRVHEHDVRRLHATAGVRPWRSLGLACVQAGLFVAVFLVLQSSNAFQGHAFLGMSNLAAPDCLLSFLPWPANLLPVALAFTIWAYARALGRGARWTWGRHLGWGTFAAGLAVLTHDWPAAWMLFTVALVASAWLTQQALSARAGAGVRGTEAGPA
jgi:eukaryotic-like serine/threonine-protein kinase